MTVRSSCAVPGIALFLTMGICSPGLTAREAVAADKAAKVKPEASCAELVRAALLAEASPVGQDRSQLLRQALARMPDFAPARWHAGYVREGGQWLEVDQVPRRTAVDNCLAEYRQRRDEQAFHPQADLNMARWCRDHGLPAEARAHWMRVLLTQPHSAEAIGALGLTWHQGRWLTREQIGQSRNPQGTAPAALTPSAKEEKEWTAYWETRVAKWRRSGEHDETAPARSMRADLDAVKEPLAIQVLGTLLATRSQWPQDRKFYQAASLVLVQWLEYREQPWAAPQLARQAVDHPLANVRAAAADALKKHAATDYLPLLLQRLRLPIEASGSIVSLGLGGVILQYSLEREGPDAIHVENHATQVHVKDVNGTTDRSLPIAATPPNSAAELKSAQPQTDLGTQQALLRNQARAAQLSVMAHQRAVATLAAVRRKVETANAETADLNRRVQFALARATGATVADDPLAWLKWWNDYCCDYYEVEYPSDEDAANRKPVYEQTYRGYAPIPFNLSGSSCFPWNTKVWTLSGAAHIEQVKPGDRVLSQHPRTGELAYKPVLHVTRRKPTPMIRIAAGKDTILATRGHPFWVCGDGWKMAKHLQAGSRLHTVSGSLLIDRLEQAPAAGPWYEQLQHRPDAKPEDVLSYNLVVDDFHTYFVGEEKFLVHDNILFPLDGPVPPVPGLALRR